MKKKTNFFEKKSVVATFGIIALIAGFFFIQPYWITPRVTGNVVTSNYDFNLIPIIGLLLLVCSIVLIAYAVVKKE